MKGNVIQALRQIESRLQGRFNFVALSQDVGFEKPGAAIFLAACEKAGCAPHELLQVGDSLDADVAGAHGVGPVSVWLNRIGANNDPGIVPKHEVPNPTEWAACLVDRTR